MISYFYSIVILFVVAVFLLMGDAEKVYSQKNKNDVQALKCIRNLEDIIKSVDENVDMDELANESAQDVIEIKYKFDVFKIQCYSIMKKATAELAKKKNCVRKCKDLISDIYMDVNKILMEMDGWSTGG